MAAGHPTRTPGEDIWATFLPRTSYWGHRAETSVSQRATQTVEEQGGPETHRSLEDIMVVQIPSSDKYLLITYFVWTAGGGEGKKH